MGSAGIVSHLDTGRLIDHLHSPDVAPLCQLGSVNTNLTGHVLDGSWIHNLKQIDRIHGAFITVSLGFVWNTFIFAVVESQAGRFLYIFLFWEYPPPLVSHKTGNSNSSQVIYFIEFLYSQNPI